MNEQQQILAEKVLKMRRAFARTESYAELRTKLEFALTYRRVALAAGVPMSPSAGNKATSFAVIGSSGSGKSTLVDRVLRTTPGLTLAEHGQPTCDVISLIVPSPATLKSLARAILAALGYPLQRERTADAIWELVRAHLRERRVLFLHLDEAQDIARHQTPKEMQAVINTLKTLMEHRDWQVGLILSGMPSLRDMLNFDRQLSRRVAPIELRRLIEPSSIAAYQQESVSLGELAAAAPGVSPAVLFSRLNKAGVRPFLDAKPLSRIYRRDTVRKCEAFRHLLVADLDMDRRLLLAQRASLAPRSFCWLAGSAHGDFA